MCVCVCSFMHACKTYLRYLSFMTLKFTYTLEGFCIKHPGRTY